MALTLGDNFSYQGAKPLDARLKYDTLAAMKAVGDATMYDGCMAYCVATDKIYQWKSSNTVDPDTGKWREFSSGGGHTIEDAEGTDLTQRDTLQFGEGFKAEDDDTNKKTVITPDVMPSEDMSEVISPLPSVQPRYHKYSTEEHIVGEWIDGKPIYERTINLPNGIPLFSANVWTNVISVDIPIERLVFSRVVSADLTAPSDCNYLALSYNTSTHYIRALHTRSIDVAAANNSFMILQYTKTTD
jgi:hypothetical protein